MTTWLPLQYRIDLYTKTVAYNESGQSVETWTKDRTIRCSFMPSRGEERLVGRVQNPRSYVIWTDDLNVSHANQMRDLQDVYGNLIESGSFNVVAVKKYAGWSKAHHAEINLQKVLE